MYERNFAVLSPSKKDMKIIPCKNGWTYDDTKYKSTVVTEVKKLDSLIRFFARPVSLTPKARSH